MRIAGSQRVACFPVSSTQKGRRTAETIISVLLAPACGSAANGLGDGPKVPAKSLIHAVKVRVFTDSRNATVSLTTCVPVHSDTDTF